MTLPARARGDLDIKRELIARVPATVSGTHDASYRDLLEEELTEREDPDDERGVWTYDALTLKITRRLARGTGDGEDTAGGSGHAHPMTRNGPAPCFNCGTKECEGHAGCEVRGPKCGEKYCPCIHGHPCMYKMKRLPKREDLRVVGRGGRQPARL